MVDVAKLDFPDRDLFILKDGDWHGFRSQPCKKEPETVEWIRSFPEHSVLWDVGASVGPYSLIAAALGYWVAAFEPFLPSVGHLQQNVWLNKFGLKDIQVHPVALGGCAEAYLGLMGISSPKPGSASHRDIDSGLVQKIIWTCADDMAQRIVPPNHVKIDVDGAELGVIEGGRNLWKTVDSIMVESVPSTIDDITVILNVAGLEMAESWKRWGGNDTKTRNYLFRRMT